MVVDWFYCIQNCLFDDIACKSCTLDMIVIIRILLNRPSNVSIILRQFPNELQQSNPFVQIQINLLGDPIGDTIV